MRSALVLPMLLLMAPTEAEACSCEAPGPPCSAMFSSTVFVGKARATTDTEGRGLTTFELIETLHAQAPLPKLVELAHGTIGGMCGITFDVGRTYVVYANASEGVLYVGGCSRTHELSKNDEDVAFAHAIPKAEKATIKGLLLRADGHGSAPLSKSIVHLMDAGVSAPVAASGAFTLQVAPGEYSVKIESPSVTEWNRELAFVRVPHPAACPRLNLTVAWNGRIRGRVLHQGRPVAGIEVHAIAKRDVDQHWRLVDITEPDGTFEIRGIQPGEFFVGVSPPSFEGTTPRSPYPATWAPGTPNRDKAKRITLGPAGSATVDLELPAPLPTSTLSITVKDAKGAPITNAHVTVIPKNANRSTGVAGDGGVYVLDELRGLELSIRACTFDSKRCAEVTKTLDRELAVELKLE